MPFAEKKRIKESLVKRIEDLLRDNRGECEIPDELIKEIARCLLPDVIKFLESDKCKEEFEKWKSNQEFDKREGNIYHIKGKN